MKFFTVCTGKSQEWLIAISLLGLSGTISNVKFWTLRREELGLNNLFYWIPMRISCIIHVSLRLVTYALLSAQYLHYAAILLPLQFLCNLFIGQRICQEIHLNVVNAALSMVAPASYNLPEGNHGQYSKWTSITFAINLSSTALLLNLLSYFKVIAIHKLPVSMSALVKLDPMHPDAMGWGVLSVIMLTALVSFASGSGITRCFWDCCHKLQVPFNEHVVERVTRVSNKISGVKACLPDGYSWIFRSYVLAIGPFGLLDYGSATLCCKI